MKLVPVKTAAADLAEEKGAAEAMAEIKAAAVDTDTTTTTIRVAAADISRHVVA